MDTLANALNAIKVAETKGFSEAKIKPSSKIIREVLLLLQQNGYIGDFEFVDDGKSGQFKVRLLGKINNCGVIKPRFPVGKETWEKYEQRYLPGKGIGLLIVSTPAGMMAHHASKEKNMGGRLMAYVY